MNKDEMKMVREILTNAGFGKGITENGTVRVPGAGVVRSVRDAWELVWSIKVGGGENER